MKRLPDTELEVMKALWASERAPVPRSSLEEALRDRGWATNTFNTSLSRLAEKGFVSCEKRGKTNYYTPQVRQADYLAFSAAGVLSETAGSGGEAMWTCRDWQESYPAQDGDTFLLTFRGVDRLTGVGYEFPIEVWYMTEGGGIRQGVPSDVQGGKLMASGLDRPSIEWPDEP